MLRSSDGGKGPPGKTLRIPEFGGQVQTDRKVEALFKAVTNRSFMPLGGRKGGDWVKGRRIRTCVALSKN